MFPFRLRFAFKRIFLSNYRNRIRSVVSSPFEFYYILLRKLSPWSSHKVFTLHLKGGGVIPVEEFWTLFVFDEVLVDHCYEGVEVISGAPYDAVIDVGANVGLFALRAKQLWPDAKILAIEPHPENFRRLQSLVAMNKLQDIRPLQVGVGERCGSAKLYLDPRNIAGHSMYKGAESGQEAMLIEIRPLADLIREIEPTSRVLVKIDCEGCEFPLISSLTVDVASRISCLVIEPERGIGFSLNQMLDKLQLLGFSVRDDGHFVTARR
jgi:FkbM family methyltransferase